jgi:hypothetical protein
MPDNTPHRLLTQCKKLESEIRALESEFSVWEADIRDEPSKHDELVQIAVKVHSIEDRFARLDKRVRAFGAQS